MKKILLLFSLILIVQTYCYSQNTLTITSEQLQTTNLIFAEHKKYSQLVPVLEANIDYLQIVNNSWQRTDSINRITIKKLEINNQEQCASIMSLKKSLKTRNKIIIGSATAIVLICLLK